MQYKHLFLIFGITLSECSHVINTMLKKVVWRLRSDPFAQVKFPDAAKMREFADMVQEQEQLVSNIMVSWTASLSLQNALTNASSRMRIIAGMTVTQW